MQKNKNVFGTGKVKTRKKKWSFAFLAALACILVVASSFAAVAQAQSVDSLTEEGIDDFAYGDELDYEDYEDDFAYGDYDDSYDDWDYEDEDDFAYGEYETWDDESDYEDYYDYAAEDALWDKIDSLYESNWEAFESLEEQLDAMYEELYLALEADDGQAILTHVKSMYAVELELIAIEDSVGLTALYEELDAIEESWDEDFEDDWYDFDASDFSHPNAESLIKQIEELDSKAWEIEEANWDAFESLWEKEDALYLQFDSIEETGSYKEMRSLENQLDAIDLEYEKLESSLGLDQIYDELESLEDELFGFEQKWHF